MGGRSARWNGELLLRHSAFFASQLRCACQAEIIVGVIFDPIRNELWTRAKKERPRN